MAFAPNHLQLHANLSQRIVIRPDDYIWVDSPAEGVRRMMLDRDGDEIGRATSLVAYAPSSCFPKHTHGGGEEIFVLSGTFSDEHGHYPEGSYIRNPIGSSHTPQIGADGALLFVKLWQMQEDDAERQVMQTKDASWFQGLVTGLKVLPLYEHGTEHAALVRWAPNTHFSRHQHWGGEEILVIEGTFYDEHGSYPKGSWLRSPHLSQHQPFTREDGALIYVKTGHLHTPSS
ncbi:MAG: cupin domain-containing protein [Burkholderiaceae bacterium]